jgi:predicted CDP-diglyceride synthetase/phosphatidate cytidylyltransferase
MKHVVQLMITLFVALIIYLLVYRLCFSNDFRSSGSQAQWISLSIAFLCSIVCWLKTGNISNSAGGYMAGLGILGGVIRWLVGLWAPIILLPSNNLAPLLGMLIITPAGLLAGVVLGLMQWKMKKDLPNL